jgi:nucleoid-associated protein YgaU
VYGDPEKWKVLYLANKARLPQPDNPDLINPGMVLEIPSLWGETRQGMWEPNKEYGTP